MILIFFLGTSMALASSPPPSPSLPQLSSLAVRGSTVRLVFKVPAHPSGVFFYLSLDGNRLLGRRIVPNSTLPLCVSHLSTGPHRLGYQTARKDHIVLIDPVIIPVTVPGGSPTECSGTGSGRKRG
ncbi:MAG: hypothetical protein M1509_01895 [Nitrospirae bacterium]|nr:hypothetical protein [Nitrospirota bacterium]